ncbi:MAG: transglycosylase SLT domain-containing protein [Desulfobacula sp.]|nr:transglycosylase SLT domain-containing protein [Desulfobacula sp.]
MDDACWYRCKAKAKKQMAKPLVVLLLGVLCFFAAFPSPVFAVFTEGGHSSDREFPLYPAIKPNVDFWVNIFTKYSKAHGVIHDINNLSIVYEVVTLDPSETVCAANTNKTVKAAAAQKYREILLKLASGTAPLSDEEIRVSALFGKTASPAEFELAASNIRCQTGLSKEFKEGLIRAGAVLDEFKRIFKSYGLPEDLVYLPCVESSYNFKAYSKLGAAGIWQFTHDTGKIYMNIDYVVDERRDPYISTDAAARLLKKNYAVLGEWPLAITAYNHGLTGMLRAKNTAGNYENIFKTYQGSSFKFASRNFYSEFLAARIVAKNHEKHFGTLSFQNPSAFQTVKTKGYLMAKDLMTQFNLSAEDIQNLNPSLRPPVFTEQKYIPKGFNLKLPKTFSLHEIDTRLAGLYKSGQKPSRFHQVRKGETASSIARLHSIRLNDLIRANDLGAKAALFIGQNLRIPVRDEIIITAKYEPAKAKEMSPETTVPAPVPENPVQAEKPAEPETVVAQAPAAPSPEAPAQTKPEPAALLEPTASPEPTVLPAPTALPEPESKSSAGPEALAETTGSPGYETPIDPMFDTMAKPATNVATVNPRIDMSDLKILQLEKKGSLPIGIIKVEAEETLGHYAGWLKVSAQEIRKLNAFKPHDPISIDRRIKIPLKKTTAQAFEEQRFEFHKEMEEDFFGSFSINGVDTYEIKNGDNIWRLCENELEVPFWLLKKYNPEIDFNSLQLRQKIKYPIIGKAKAK